MSNSLRNIALRAAGSGLDSDIAYPRNRKNYKNNFLNNLQSPALSNTYKVGLQLAQTGAETSAGSSLNSWLTSAGVFSGTSPDRFDFLCAEAMIPGTTFQTYQELGSRQGVQEAFPMRREYTDMAMSFYVSSDYQVLRLFQEWINFANPVYNGSGGTPKSGSPGGYPNANVRNGYHRFRYPNYYKRNISITKFERNIKESIEYTFINAFPITVKSIPLSYEGAQLLQVGVEFKYDRYIITQQNKPVRDQPLTPRKSSKSGSEQSTVANDAQEHDYGSDGGYGGVWTGGGTPATGSAGGGNGTDPGASNS